jgi:nucleoside-diphosphate-sugar epimerase
LDLKTINLAAICTPADYNTRPLDTIYSNFIDALPVVKYCSENNKRLIHFSTCEVYGKTVGSFLPKDHPLRKVTIIPPCLTLCLSSLMVLLHNFVPTVVFLSI